MESLTHYFYCILLLTLTGCISNDYIDDFVEPVLRITSTIDTISVNTSFQFEQVYLNNVGIEESVVPIWTSSDSEILEITESGLANAKQLGQATVQLSFNNGDQLLTDSRAIVVGQMTSFNNAAIQGKIATTSSYELTGDFEYKQEGANAILTFSDNYKASTALPGLYVYLSNNANTISNALEIGRVEVFQGSHTYTIPDVSTTDYAYLLYYCKPFNVKVGDGQIQ